MSEINLTPELIRASAAEYYIACIGLSRDLERIADFAADICEHIIYLHSGKIIRHSL